MLSDSYRHLIHFFYIYDFFSRCTVRVASALLCSGHPSSSFPQAAPLLLGSLSVCEWKQLPCSVAVGAGSSVSWEQARRWHAKYSIIVFSDVSTHL